MRNVHVVPRVDTLIAWLDAAGFEDVETIDVSRTGTDEQRSTAWMTFGSLIDCLDPEDPQRTVEGYPAPVRAALLARRPAV
jgi:tRNA (mo5U34)-methyltransferase